ncbi:MAG: hypothetical protein IKL42_01765, partial [Clostridia bacterium]|nr:hypothetical protein [Clostridia bacterium]
MKKLFSVIILVALILSGCNTPSDKTQIEKRAVRMINVDGRLYYDSGLLSKHTVKCGTMDGDLIKTVAENEIPQADGQCNFDGAKGYQHTSKITKEVLLDEGWTIFKLFENDGKDISRFKYCYYIKGRHPNAEKDTEIVVLSKTEDVTFAQTAGRMFSSQFDTNEKETAIF